MSTPTSYPTPDFSAGATVRSVLAQVHRRTARAASLRGVPAIATVAEDEPDLRVAVRKATRHVAVRTGRVLREGVAEWADNADAGVAVLPAWAAGARLSYATWTPAGATATEPLRVVHGRLQALVRGEAGEPRTLYVGAGGAVLLLPDPGVDGVVAFAAAARFGLDEAADPAADAFASDGSGLLFPPELEEAVVRFVLSAWFEDLDPDESARHMDRFEDELAVFGTDARQEGFARSGHAAPAQTARRRRR